MSDRHLTVPFTDKPIDDEKSRVLAFLFSHREEWFKARVIEQECNIPHRQTSERLRRLIKELVADHKVPIISGTNGFCFTYNRELVVQCLNNYASRMRGIKASYDELVQAYKSHGGYL